MAGRSLVCWGSVFQGTHLDAPSTAVGHLEAHLPLAHSKRYSAACSVLFASLSSGMSTFNFFIACFPEHELRHAHLQMVRLNLEGTDSLPDHGDKES
jgi:hypothetical protein